MKIARFTYNPFQENTYVLYDGSGECVIIDPGCYFAEEKEELKAFLDSEQLRPVLLLHTHCHIDHVLGNSFIHSTYGLVPQIHPAEQLLLKSAASYGQVYGLMMDPSPEGQETLRDGGIVRFGGTQLLQIHAPGHSPGSICFYHQESGNLIGGDVLFERSIGRTDLPGGDHAQLLQSIRMKLFCLPDTTIVHPGHGEPTRIGFEKSNNPFLNDR